MKQHNSKVEAIISSTVNNWNGVDEKVFIEQFRDFYTLSFPNSKINWGDVWSNLIGKHTVIVDEENFEEDLEGFDEPEWEYGAYCIKKNVIQVLIDYYDGLF